MSLDDLRARFPHLGFGLYALTPGAPVTLEVYSDDELFSFEGATEAATIATAFPDLAHPVSAVAELLPEQAAVNAAHEAATSIFD